MSWPTNVSGQTITETVQLPNTVNTNATLIHEQEPYGLCEADYLRLRSTHQTWEAITGYLLAPLVVMWPVYGIKKLYYKMHPSEAAMTNSVDWVVLLALSLIWLVCLVISKVWPSEKTKVLKEIQRHFEANPKRTRLKQP